MKTLIGEHQEAGDHSVPWDGRNASGDEVPHGTYFYRLMVHPEQGRGTDDPALSGAETLAATKKLIVLR